MSHGPVEIFQARRICICGDATKLDEIIPELHATYQCSFGPTI